MEVLAKNWSKHVKTKRHFNRVLRPGTLPKDPAPKKGQKQRKKRESKGQNFALTFSRYRKYYINKRMLKNPGWIQEICVSNERGGSGMGHSHSHAYVKTSTPLSFAEFQAKWKKDIRCNIADLQTARHVSTWLKYITKEDCQPVYMNVDADQFHLQARAYISCFKHRFAPLNVTMYPYKALTGAQKRDFKELYDYYVTEDRKSHSKYVNAELHGWQQAIIRLLSVQTDRQVLWIFDKEGGRGKTFLTQYLRDNHGAINMANGSGKDIALTYNGEPIVCFNYARSDTDHLNYRVLEDLKDGMIFSPKYNSTMKTFDPPKVVCMANYEPEYDRLSHDRWVVYEIQENGTLKNALL